MDDKILKIVESIKERLIIARRDFHRYAESGWTEFRTAAIVADRLENLGYKVLAGDDVIAAESMMGVPADHILAGHQERALSQGANPKWVVKMTGGKTGVMGVMDFAQPGPTVVLRFDIDANDALEAETNNHRPYREKFASVNKGAMHACGHDGHVAIGLGVAEVLAELKENLKGKVKLIFQPGEEGSRGARAMVAKGIVDDADYLIGFHIGFDKKKSGQLSCATKGFLATSKIDAVFKGKPAHAGAAPEEGRNALLAASVAVQNLHAITRHSAGASRVNVGVIQGGTGRNVIPSSAKLVMETRGETSQINEYMYNEAVRILKSAAQMHNVEVSLIEMGGAAGASSDLDLAGRISKTAARLKLFDEIMPPVHFGASEDCTYFMEKVQQCGGKATYMLIGTEIAAGHHDSLFDFNEDVLATATFFVSAMAADLLLEKI